MLKYAIRARLRYIATITDFSHPRMTKYQVYRFRWMTRIKYDKGW